MTETNTLLDHVEAPLRSGLDRKASAQTMEKGQSLQRAGEAVDHVWFPSTAVLVQGTEMLSGESLDVSLVGREGAVGVFETCGSGRVYAQTSVLVPGVAYRMSASAYRELFAQSEGLRRAIHQYVEILLAEARQSVACNAMHSVDSRLARTLLEIGERMQQRRLPLTQDALAGLLGVQRTTVAASISGLQRQGLVQGARGMIEILDRPGLERTACSCRRTLAFVRRDIQSADPHLCEE